MQKDCIKDQWCLWNVFFLVGVENLLNHIARNIFMET
jgi:hypothetical protein